MCPALHATQAAFASGIIGDLSLDVSVQGVYGKGTGKDAPAPNDWWRQNVVLSGLIARRFVRLSTSVTH